jgi:hypothetical protein
MRDIVSEIETIIPMVGEDNPDALARIQRLGHRLKNLHRELAGRIEFFDYLASIDESISSSEAIRLVEEARTNRKSLAKVPNTQFNGFRKKGFDKHLPNPKNKVRFDRSKIKSY